MEVLEELKLVEPSWPQYDIISSRQQVNLFLSGQGGGKTFIGGVVSGNLITSFPKMYGFIGANTYTQLSDSTLKRIRAVWKEDFGWSEWSKVNPHGNYVVDKQPPAHFSIEGHDFDTYHGKICFETGTVIFKGSLENYKAHDGKEFGWAILDETKDTREEAVKEVITGRLRQHGMYVMPVPDETGNDLTDQPTNEDGTTNTPWNPLFILTSPAKVQWINQWFKLDDYVKEITETIYSDTNYFVRDIENKRVVICSTFHNQKNLPSNYITNQMSNLHSGLQDMLIYGNPFTSAGGEFYKCFLRTKHAIDVRTLKVKVEAELARSFGVKDGEEVCIFNDGARAYCKFLPLHVSFDFNVNPYITCTVWQVYKNLIVQIDEICLSNPVNTTDALCREIVRRYQGHDQGMFVYGDPSGKQEDTRSEKGYNDFVIIMRALVSFRPSQRIGSAAPPVVMRGNFINTIFEKGYEGLEIYIHNKCQKSIDDYVYLKEASDGTKLKEKVKNPDTQVTYEKYGHTSDSGDYFICIAFSKQFYMYMRGGSAAAGATGGKRAPSKSSY